MYSLNLKIDRWIPLNIRQMCIPFRDGYLVWEGLGRRMGEEDRV